MSVPYRRHDPHKVVKVVAWDGRSGEQKEVSYTNRKSVGHGTFGIVYRAKVASPQGEDDIAIKKVWQNELSRELQILRLISHTNVVELKAFYWSHPYKDEESQDKDQLRINLVLEYVPDTVYDACDRYIGLNERPIPIFETKLYMYQVLRALGYIHSMGICHRDIKPDNLLINPATGVLKLSDFGSAKLLVAGEPNVSYICSRHYRAPELIFADTNYTTYIDIWSIACVMAELILGYQLFRGGCWVSQLAAIVSVLGTPSREQIKSWNPKLQDRRFPRIKPRPLSKVFPSETPEEATDLLSKLLKHTPESRLSGYEAMCHSFFDELRVEGQKMPNGQDLPPLFDFTREELSIHPDLMRQLVPSHCELELESRGIRLDTFVPIALERLTCLPPEPAVVVPPTAQNETDLSPIQSPRYLTPDISHYVWGGCETQNDVALSPTHSLGDSWGVPETQNSWGFSETQDEVAPSTEPPRDVQINTSPSNVPTNSWGGPETQDEIALSTEPPRDVQISTSPSNVPTNSWVLPEPQNSWGFSETQDEVAPSTEPPRDVQINTFPSNVPTNSWGGPETQDEIALSTEPQGDH